VFLPGEGQDFRICSEKQGGERKSGLFPDADSGRRQALHCRSRCCRHVDKRTASTSTSIGVAPDAFKMMMKFRLQEK
jgi:hypothetical protein